MSCTSGVGWGSPTMLSEKTLFRMTILAPLDRSVWSRTHAQPLGPWTPVHVTISRLASSSPANRVAP